MNPDTVAGILVEGVARVTKDVALVLGLTVSVTCLEDAARFLCVLLLSISARRFSRRARSASSRSRSFSLAASALAAMSAACGELRHFALAAVSASRFSARIMPSHCLMLHSRSWWLSVCSLT